MNKDRERAWDRRVHEGLRELAGVERRGDLVAGVLARLGAVGESDVGACPARRRRQQSRALLAAATLALGTAAVFATLLLRQSPDDAELADPMRFRHLSTYVVDGLAAVELMPPDTPMIMVTATDADVLDALVRFDAGRASPGLVDVWIRWSDEEVNRGLDDRQIARLAGLTNTEHLDFELSPDATGAGLAQLAALPRLSSLWLRGCTHSSEQLAALAALPHLRHLYIEWSDDEPVPPRPADSIAFLAKLPRLRSVHFGEAWHLTAKDLEVLAQLQDLRRLNLLHCTGKRMWKVEQGQPDGDGVGVTDDTLRMLAEIRMLESLHIGGKHSYTAAGLRALADLPNLRTLDISYAELTAAELAALPTGIEELITYRRSVPSEAVARLPNLRRLEMRPCGWRAEDWSVLDPARMQGLSVSGLDDRVVPAAFLERCQGMRDLLIWGGGHDRRHVRAIAGMKDLRTLELAGFEFRDEWIPWLAGATGLCELRLDCRGLTGRADLLDSLRHLPLRRIDLPDDVARSELLRARIRELWPAAALNPD